MPPVGFEPKISGGERPKTYALDRADTGTGTQSIRYVKKYSYYLYATITRFTLKETY
jgi:hypothetical protein